MNSTVGFIKKLFVYIMGLFIVAVGTRLSVIASLGLGAGAAAANSLTAVVNIGFDLGFYRMDSLSAWMFVISVLVIIAQVLILRKDFKIYNLLQLVFMFIFSTFITYVDPLVNWWQPSAYWVRYVQLLICLPLTGLGIFCVVITKIVPMPPEGLINAIMQKTGKGTVGSLRTAYDVSQLLLAIIIGWIAVGNPFYSVREGTVITALCTGIFVDIFSKLIGNPVGKFCFGKDYVHPVKQKKAKA